MSRISKLRQNMLVIFRRFRELGQPVTVDVLNQILDNPSHSIRGRLSEMVRDGTLVKKKKRADRKVVRSKQGRVVYNYFLKKGI